LKNSFPRVSREIPFARPVIGEDEKQAVLDVLGGHVLTHGPKCTEFEENFASYIGTKHAITMSSCTTALHLSLLALGVSSEDEVIVPAETHVATAHAVEHAGARPVFIDVEDKSGNINPDLIKRAITSRTKAVIVVHYLGLPCNMEAIRSVTDSQGVSVIEDCALALGATYGGELPGSLGSTGCFSFYPSKHITTMEGGMLTTNSDNIASIVRKQRAFGYDKGYGQRSVPGIYDVVMLGYNYRMSEVQAAVGIAQMNRLSDLLQTRRRNAEVLLSRLSEIDCLTTFPVDYGLGRSACFCVNVILPDNDSFSREEVVLELNRVGIGTSVHYPVALPLTSYYRRRYNYQAQAFPVARWISEKAISLPVGPHLGKQDMNYIAEELQSILSN